MHVDFNVLALDDIIHSRLRLGIMAQLAAGKAATFTELKARLKAADGNLSVQLRKLEEAGYVEIEKGFANRRPVTTARLTPQGREAFRSYISTLSELVDHAKRDAE